MSIIEQLPLNNNNEDILWKLDDIDLYQKYTQQVHVQTPVKPDKSKIPIFQSFFLINNTNTTNTTKTTNTTNTTNKSNKLDPDTVSEKKETIRRVKRESPMTVILKLSENIEINSGYTQQKLIEFISKKEFIKFFGVKKSSEVMSAISANKLNKSLVIFVSFLFV